MLRCGLNYPDCSTILICVIRTRRWSSESTRRTRLACQHDFIEVLIQCAKARNNQCIYSLQVSSLNTSYLCVNKEFVIVFTTSGALARYTVQSPRNQNRRFRPDSVKHSKCVVKHSRRLDYFTLRTIGSSPPAKSVNRLISLFHTYDVVRVLTSCSTGYITQVREQMAALHSLRQSVLRFQGPTPIGQREFGASFP